MKIDLPLTEKALRQLWERNLKKFDVVFPKSGQRLTALLYLYSYMPDWISKDDLTDMVRQYHKGSRDFQEGRHLADEGWDIVSTNSRFTRGRCEKDGPKNSYKLGSVEHPNSVWLVKSKIKRRGYLGAESWNELLIAYEEIGCAVCGRTYDHYDKGHIDPTKPPKVGNIVPMCVDCNQHAQAHEHAFIMNGLIARGYKP